jgi:beta-galactosidase GanA
LKYYNNKRPHSGKYYYDKTPMQTWKDGLHLTKEKLLDTLNQNFVSLTASDEEETGAAGAQLVRNNLTDWNG